MGRNRKRPATLVENRRPSSRDKRADVGDVGHDGAVAGELARLRRRASIAGSRSSRRGGGRGRDTTR